MREDELLAIRASYPQSSGWATACSWLFSPQNAEQRTMGLRAVERGDLYEQCVAHAGNSTGRTGTNWDAYDQCIGAVALDAELPALADFIWGLYCWARKNKTVEESYRYIRSILPTPELSTLLWRSRRLPSVLSDQIELDSGKRSLELLFQSFGDVVLSPVATANVVSAFLQALRDSQEDKRVIAAFFDGLSISSGSGVSWSAGPMMAALIANNARTSVRLYEVFVARLIDSAWSRSNDWPSWQRAYDAEFKSWVNIFATGMFNPDSSTGYEP